MRSDEAVRHAVSRSNVVVNCLGADKETMNYGYEEVHIEFAERIARACAESEVLERLLHVSCIAAAPDAPSRRLTTKVCLHDLAMIWAQLRPLLHARRLGDASRG